MAILDNIKEVAKAVQEINNLELYQRVLNLHSDIIGLVEENNRLRDENKKLTETVALTNAMSFQEPFYFQEGDKTPFCPTCWEGKRQAIHVSYHSSGDRATSWLCPSCKNMFDAYDGPGRLPPHETGRGRRTSGGPNDWMR